MNETLELGRANGLAPFRSTAERCKEVAWGWSSKIYRVSSTLILFSNIPSFILLQEVNQKNNRKSKCPTSFSTSCRSRVSCDHTHSSYCDVSISLQTSRKQRYASERSFKSSVRLLETLTQPTFLYVRTLVVSSPGIPSWCQVPRSTPLGIVPLLPLVVWFITVIHYLIWPKKVARQIWPIQREY